MPWISLVEYKNEETGKGKTIGKNIINKFVIGGQVRIMTKRRTLDEIYKIRNDFDDIHNKGYPIVKSNDLVQRSRSGFTKFQNKLISIICFKIPSPVVSHDGITVESKDIPLDYKITVQEIAKIRGVALTGAFYDQVKSDMKYIRDNSFWMKNEAGETVTVAWLNKVRVNEKMENVDFDGTKSTQYGNGVIQYSLDPDIVPFISNIIGKYTKYELNDVLNLEKEKSIPLFEYLVSNAYRTTFSVTFDYLKWMLMLDDTEIYKQFKFFNRDILKPIVNEINENTSYEVQYKPIGRPVTEVMFLVRKKDYGSD